MSEFKFNHPSGIMIEGSLTEFQLKSTLNLAATDMGTGWFWYNLPLATASSGEHFSMRLAFLSGKLREIHITYINNEANEKNWDKWSEKEERLRAKKSDNWLSEHGFPSGKYPWGEVWSGYDSKGGSGCTIVRFKA